MTIEYSPTGHVVHFYEGTQRQVREGDLITTVQYPGGMFPPGDPKTGRAVKFPHEPEALAAIERFNDAQGRIAIDPDELVCEVVEHAGTPRQRVAYYNIHMVHPA